MNRLVLQRIIPCMQQNPLWALLHFYLAFTGNKGPKLFYFDWWSFEGKED